MKDKVLIVTTTPYMIKQFLMNDICTLQKLGYDIEIATNFQSFNVMPEKELLKFKEKLLDLNIEINQVDFTRNVLDFKSLASSYRQMKTLLHKNHYCMMHTHTPVASAVSRCAARNAKSMKVIYTAHGFHFFKGASLKNWLLFYPIEKIFSKYTDVLITINQEDYEAAKKFKAKRVEYVPGVGIDTQKIADLNFAREEKREQFGIKKEDLVLLSVGEINKNKNQEVVIRALAELNRSDIQYYIAGQGPEREHLEKLAEEKGISGQVHFLGYRSDVLDWYKMADIFCFPSYREGLSVALMEAMASGLPVIVSETRGNVDLVIPQKGGILCNPSDDRQFAAAIKKLAENAALREAFSMYNKKRMEEFDAGKIRERMQEIYEMALAEGI